MRKILFLLFFILISLSTYAQSDSIVVKNDKSRIVQKKFDSKKLESYKKDSDFKYVELKTEHKPTFIERVFHWMKRLVSRFFEWIFGVKYAKGILATFLSALPYIIAGIVLFLLLKFFLKVTISSIVETGKNKPVITITNEEALIKNVDLIKLIHKAVAQGNYRLAVRYYYLNTLKQLENNKFIIWEQQKTNEDYSQEILQQNIQKSFVKLTRLYDFVWYGNFKINETEFSAIELNFNEVNNLINKN
tara:strand:- start:10924 stop:11664 length:741 start_codon:yes stop_codon:yes gene_type:complete